MADIIIHTSPADERARPLVEALAAEYEALYGDYFKTEDGLTEMERYPPELFAPPAGNFLLLERDGTVIAGGAFKRYDDETAELKRIWTEATLRRQGIARRIVTELEWQAARQGYTRLYLTTGFRQLGAARLYLTSGYTPLFDTSVDPEIYKSLPFTKDISGLRAALQEKAFAAAGEAAGRGRR
ncbi:GNAT family N-acetyltransferase [Pseudochelatococcus sp. B33]